MTSRLGTNISPLLLPQIEESYGLRRRSSQIISESLSINEGRDRGDSMQVFKQSEKVRQNQGLISKGMISPGISPRLSSTGLVGMQQPTSNHLSTSSPAIPANNLQAMLQFHLGSNRVVLPP